MVGDHMCLLSSAYSKENQNYREGLDMNSVGVVLKEYRYRGLALQSYPCLFCFHICDKVESATQYTLTRECCIFFKETWNVKNLKFCHEKNIQYTPH